MAKKPNPQRSDAERRARQVQRLARVVRALHCIMGGGRWDAEALAQELGCSVRTVHRILQTLAEAGVPYRFDPETRAYKVPRGFKFPGIEPAAEASQAADSRRIIASARRLLSDLERTSASLRELLASLEGDA